jgi:hypothetical protein
MLARFPGDPYIAQQAKTLIDYGKAQRDQAYQARLKTYESDLALRNQQTLATDTFNRGAPERELERKAKEAEIAKAQRDAATAQETLVAAQRQNQLREKFAGMNPEDVYKEMKTSQSAAKQAQQGLEASNAAMKAFDKGAISGFGANQRLDVAKLFTALGLVDKGDRIANTETFRNAMQPVVAAILHQTSGTSQLSEGELAFAKAASAGNITLDPQSIRQLMTIIDKRSREVIADHQEKMDAVFGKGNAAANALYGVPMPVLSQKASGVAEGATATGPNGAKMIVRDGYWEKK